MQRVQQLLVFKNKSVSRHLLLQRTTCGALTFREITHFAPKNKRVWRMRASIPLPLTCKTSALPFELIPHKNCQPGKYSPAAEDLVWIYQPVFFPFTYSVYHAVFSWEILSHARGLRGFKRGVKITKDQRLWTMNIQRFQRDVYEEAKPAWEQKVNVLQKVRPSHVSNGESIMVTKHNILL